MNDTTSYDTVRNSAAIEREGSVSGTADGTLIKRNTRYILNVTLKKLGSGTTDPDGPGDPAAVEVTVTTEGWEGPLVQDVEW